MDKGADYILRLRANAFKLYKESGEEIFLPDSLQGLEEGESINLSCFYKGGNVLKPIRICAVKKSKKAEENGIRQIKKSNSKKMRGKFSITRNFFSFFFTG